MQICPKCQAELTNLNSSSCYYCGADVSSVNNNEKDNNDLEISNSDPYSNEYPEKNSIEFDDDDLGIETPASLMESKAAIESPLETQNDSLAQSDPDINPNNKKSVETEIETDKVKKLSEQDIADIEKSLYKRDSYINQKEKSDLIEKLSHIEEQPFGNTPIDPKQLKADSDSDSSEHLSSFAESNSHLSNEQPGSAESFLPSPKIAKKGQSIAYFYKNYIELQGSQTLHPEDIVTVHAKEYVLHPKQLSKKIIFTLAGSLALVLIVIIGSLMLGGNSYGEGKVIGIVLDEFDRPYIEGATVKFSELGKESRSNSQGFFVFNNIPAGVHNIEYEINGQLVNSDFTTIADNQQSLLILRPSEDIAFEDNNNFEVTENQDSNNKNNEKPDVNYTDVRTDNNGSNTKTETKSNNTFADNSQAKNENKTTKSKSQTTTTTKQKNTSDSEYGKLTLAANIEGAKVELDGKVLGAGNLTYSKIKAGPHKYKVSLDGYKPVSGSFSLEGSDTKVLEINLEPMTKKEKKQSFASDDYFYSANNALKSGDYQTAVADFSEVINKYPNSIDSYYGRAEAYSKLKSWDKAYNDYIKAAEMHRFKGDNNEAISCYNNAISIDDNRVTAFLGRANLYLDSREYRAALVDYDKVLKIDKRNYAGYFGMGEVYFHQQRYSKAIDYFKDARSLDDTNPLIYQYLTISYMFESDDKNVKKSYDKFMELASDNQKDSFKKDSKFSRVEKIVQNH